MSFSVKQEKNLINDWKNLVAHDYILVLTATLIMMSLRPNGLRSYQMVK